MKTLTKHFTLIIVLLMAAGTLQAQEKTVINFENATIGSFPAGWTNASGKWVV